MKVEGLPREDANRSMSSAIRAGDIEQVRAQLEAPDAAATIQGQYRRFGPMHEAIISPRAIEIIPILARGGLDINSYDSRGDTPLQWAINTSASKEVFEVLIKHGANVHVRDNDEKTLLFSAAQMGLVELCRTLIDAGIDVNAVAKDGWTALHMAALNERIEICRILVDGGASPSWRSEYASDDYLTPFQTAVQLAAVKSVIYFATECGEDFAQRTSDGRSMRELIGSKATALAALTEIEAQLALGGAAKSLSTPEAEGAASYESRGQGPL
jgi:ankyrin repeat protein